MEFQIISLLVIGGLLSIVGGFLTWKYADFFLARRDYYVNSKFDLLKKEIINEFRSCWNNHFSNNNGRKFINRQKQKAN